MKNRTHLPLVVSFLSILFVSGVAEARMETEVIECSVAESPCSPIVNPNRQKILLADAESLPAHCSFSYSDYDLVVTGPADCAGLFKVWVHFEDYQSTHPYRLENVRLPVLEGAQWSGSWVAVPEAIPNFRKVHGVALLSMSGWCSWSYDEKNITMMKAPGYTGSCQGVFKALTGPAY